MISRKRILEEYQTSGGSVPYLEWLHAVKDGQTRAVIRNRVDRLEEGNPGHWKSVGHGIYELKIHFGSGFRVYFAEYGPILIILLCGGDKKTQQKDIQNAQKYWSDYRRRKHGT
jgi:putative addiction module killer protein